MAGVAKISVIVLSVLGMLAAVGNALKKGAHSDVETGGVLIGVIINIWIIVAVSVWWET